MWQIIKSLFRYSWKNCISFLMLFALLSVSSGVFSTLMMLSSNLSNSYNTLIEKGNLNNIVINELYSTTYNGVDESGKPISLTGEESKLMNKIEFNKELGKLIGKDSFRDFKAIDFTNSSSGYVYKIVDANNNVSIDKTVIYEGTNVLTQTFDFDQLIADANWSLDGLINKQARRLVAFLAAKSRWTNDSYGEQFKTEALQYLSITDTNAQKYDPKNWPLTSGVIFKKNTLAGWMKIWFDSTSSSYTAPTSKGYRLSLDVSGTVPVVGRIDNLSAYTAVVPNYVLENHDKQIAPNSIIEKLNSYNTVPYNNNKQTIYDYNYSNFSNEYIYQTEIESYIKSIDSKYKIKVDNIEYVITGQGISPSFMYPVYSFERQTPNIENEILIYANDAGYQLSYDSARSSPVESYIIAKVPDNQLNYYINKINELSRQYMAWPGNINSTYSIYDATNYLVPNALRVSFLPKLVESQIAISNSLMIFIAVLISMIFIFTIKKYINDNRSSLGALRANGIKKRWIVSCIPLLSLIPAVGGGLSGYLFAQFTQELFINLYSFYWTIPTPLTVFNPLLFFGLLLIPFAVMSLISIVSTYILLKGDTNKLLNEPARFKSSWISKYASTLFSKASILTKFRTSIAFSSIPKLIMISIMFALLGISTTAGMALHNKFSDVRSATFDNKNYNFAIDLITPTIQNGMYFRQQEDFPARYVLNDKNAILNFTIGSVDTNYMDLRQQQGNRLYMENNSIVNSYDRMKTSNLQNVVGTNSIMQIPSINDSSWQSSDFSYLSNRFMTQIIMDNEVGLGSTSANPWDIARNLAPMNQMTLANNLTKELWTTILFDDNIYFNEASLSGILSNTDIKKMANIPLNHIFTYDKNQNPNGYGFIKQYYPYNQFENKANTTSLLEPSENTIEVYDSNNKIIEQYKVDKSKVNNTFSLSKPFVVAITTLLNLTTREYNFDFNSMNSTDADRAKKYLQKVQNYKDLFFKVYYNYVPMSESDETYTKVESSTNIDVSSIFLTGIKPNSTMISLVNLNGDIVNEKLKLETIDESKFDSSNLHNIYTNTNKSLLSDERNFKLIINESAAYKYNLKVGDYIEVNPTNEATIFNNYKDKVKYDYYDEINNSTYRFKIVDIVTTYQNPEFYINQRIANLINGMTEKEIINTSFYNHYQKNNVTDQPSWFNYDCNFTVEQIDPFNGFFTKQESPEVVNSLPLYSQSGLAPAIDKFIDGKFYNELIVNVMKSTEIDLTKPDNQNKYISKMKLSHALGYDSVQELDNYWNSLSGDNNAKASVILNDLIITYGQSPLLSTAYFIESKISLYSLFGDISSFVDVIFLFVLMIIIIISLLSVFYLAIDFIYSSVALCGMLKAFGFKDSTNVFSFLSMFFPSIIIATALSIPLSIITLNLLKQFLFNFSGIYLPLFYQWWYPFIILTILFAILSITIAIAVYILKKQEVTKLIARY